MTNQELQADLAKVAAEYSHSVIPTAVLDSFKDSILLLRAKFASYEKIEEIFIERGIKVSVAGVRKFCRRHHAEMLRLRSELATTTSDDETPDTAAGTVAQNRPALTSDPGKRGPRQARDNF